MIAIPPFNATAHLFGHNAREWTPCRVIGAGIEGPDVLYVVEVRAPDGTFNLDRADIIKKAAPTV